MTSAPKIVTTSWDDGDPKDLRVAEMLAARGLSATFYIPVIGYNGRPILEPNDLRAIAAQGFEIGAHGLSHHVLPKFRKKELTREVHICKHRLEEMLGEEVVMFCYPKGRYSGRVIRELKKAGYRGARTTRMFNTTIGTDPYRIPTTLGAFPNTPTEYLKNCLRAMNFRAAIGCMLHLYKVENWVDLAKQTFDQVMRQGGLWHLYGHSWVIEEHGLWNQLGEVLDYVAHKQDVIYAPNRDLLKFMPSSNSPVETTNYCQSENTSRSH